MPDLDHPDILGTLTAKQEEDFALRLDEMIFSAENHRGGGWEGEQEFFWRLYRGVLPDRTTDWPWKGAAAYFIPVIPTAIDTFIALQQDAMFNKTPRVVGEGFQDEESARLLSKYIFSFIFEKHVPWSPLVNDWDLPTAVGGTSAVKLWYDETAFLTRRQDLVKPPTPRFERLAQEGSFEIQVPAGMTEAEYGERVQRVQANQLRVQNVDLSTLYVSPETAGGLDWPECPWYYESRQLTWEEVWRNRFDKDTGKGWRGVDDDLKGQLTERESTPTERVSAREERVSSEREPVIQQKVFYMRHVLPAEYVDEDGETQIQRWDDERGEPEECIVWYWPQSRKVADIQPLSRWRPDNKRPHVSRRHSPIPGRFYGIGMGNRLAHIQKFVNTTFNQMVDYGTLTLMPWFFFNPVLTGGIPELAGIAPGQGVPVQDPRGVQVHTFRNHDAQFQQRIQAIIPWMERASRVTDHAAGRNSQSANTPRTARGQLALLEQTSKQFSQHSELQATAYKEMLRRSISLIRAHTDLDDPIEFSYLERSPGEPPILNRATIPPHLFRGDIDFDIEISPNELLQQQNAQNFFQLMIQLVQAPIDPEMIVSLGRDLAASFGKAERFDELVDKIRRQQQVQLAQQQAGGQQAPEAAGAAPGSAPATPGSAGPVAVGA